MLLKGVNYGYSVVHAYTFISLKKEFEAMKVLSSNSALEKALIQLIRKHEQISIAVAWASAGTNLFDTLLEHRNKLLNTTIGTHFYQTDPAVLHEFVNSEQVRFITQTNGVFHPKLYFFQTGDVWEAVIGSANMTRGALTTNSELSVHLSNRDDVDGSSYDELKRQIKSYFEIAVSIDREYADTYAVYHKRQKPKLDNLSDSYGDTTASKPLIDSMVMRMHWESYVEAVQRDVNHDILNRLDLLDFIQSHFAQYDNYKSMPLGIRKTIAGLPNDTNKYWGWFGSMKGAGVFHSNINNNNEYISDALDCIPLNGEVSYSQYQNYVETFKKAFPNGRDGVSVASRLLAMKRPDFFVCIDSRNNKAMCTDFGITVSGMTYERYWKELISRIHESLWYDVENSVSDSDQRIWKGRVALIDCIFYEEK